MSDIEFLDEIKEEKQQMLNKPFREGQYGYHHTVVGKIVYQRPKHFFSKADWDRIGRKYFITLVEANDAQMPDAPWWMRILRKYTLDMLDEIFDKIPVLKIIGIEPEYLYNEIQIQSTEIGMKFADVLSASGRLEEANLIRAAFTPYSFLEATTRTAAP